MLSRLLNKKKAKSGWLYAFKCYGDCVIQGQKYSIFKVGYSRRSHPSKRLMEFMGPAKPVELLHMHLTDYPKKAERQILTGLRQNPNIHQIKDIGREYFACPSIQYFDECVSDLFARYIKTDLVGVSPPRRRSARIAAYRRKRK